MRDSIFGWDLPPGCTERDIEQAFGGRDEELDGPDEMSDAERKQEQREAAADRAEDERKDREMGL